MIVRETYEPGMSIVNSSEDFGEEGSTEIEVDLDKSSKSSTMFSAKRSGSI